MGRKAGESSGAGPGAAVPWEGRCSGALRAQRRLPTHTRPLSASAECRGGCPAALWEQCALHLEVRSQDQTEKFSLKLFKFYIGIWRAAVLCSCRVHSSREVQSYICHAFSISFPA